jgi:hypothetical protein
MIAHPPCTFLAISGSQWLSHPEDKHLPFDERRPNPKYPNRRIDMMESVEFVKQMYNSNIKRVAIENPIGTLSSLWMKPHQIIQPYMFGDEATKSTCLWLKNLPNLEPTNIVGKGEMVEFISAKGIKKRQPKWYMDILKEAKTPEQRRTLRSKTFQGIADAIAEQWSKELYK